MLRLLTLLALAIVIYVTIRRLSNAHRSAPDSGTAAGANTVAGREEALAILGLGADASRDQIIAAHRQLIQKLHPDRGGNAYLAAQINRAKDVLLQ